MKYSYNTSGTGILFGAYFFIIGVNSFIISSNKQSTKKINYFPSSFFCKKDVEERKKKNLFSAI